MYYFNVSIQFLFMSPVIAVTLAREFKIFALVTH